MTSRTLLRSTEELSEPYFEEGDIRYVKGNMTGTNYCLIGIVPKNYAESK